ncbi:MAG: hypothetical protein ACRCSF_02555 [Mycobacteriaceae bacterium]
MIHKVVAATMSLATALLSDAGASAESIAVNRPAVNLDYAATDPLRTDWWDNWGSCAASIGGGATTGAIVAGLAGAGIGTVALPVIGTVSGGAFGAIAGGVNGALSGAAAGC